MWFGMDTRGKSLPIDNLPAGGKVVRFRYRAERLAFVFVRVGAELQKWTFGPSTEKPAAGGRFFSGCQSSVLNDLVAVNARVQA